MAEATTHTVETRMAKAITSDQQSLNGDANPNLRLTATLLNGNNYLSWARSVSLTLNGRGKIGYINGKIKKKQNPRKKVRLTLKH